MSASQAGAVIWPPASKEGMSRIADRVKQAFTSTRAHDEGCEPLLQPGEAGGSGDTAGGGGGRAGGGGDTAGGSGDTAGGAADKRGRERERFAALGRELCTAWEASVGRPMFATELLRHIRGAYKSRGAGVSLAAFASGAHAAQSASFAAARQVHREYLGDDLSEEAFIKKDLFSYDDDEDPEAFKRRIEDELLEGEAYGRKMRARLSGVYRRAFGEDMHPDDLEHCFALSRAARSAVSGDDANRLAAGLNDELNAVALAVARVYGDVLGRDPEPAEVRDEVQGFRACASARPAGRLKEEDGSGADERFAAAEDALRLRLHGGLEFHDVLKGIINERAGGGLSQRDLFRALRAVLDACSGRPEALTEGGNPASDRAAWKIDPREYVVRT